MALQMATGQVDEAMYRNKTTTLALISTELRSSCYQIANQTVD